MANRNTTLNLPGSLILKTKAYAAAQGTTMTAIIRDHLEAITAEPEVLPDNTLEAYAEGMVSRDEAIRRTGVRDYAELLVSLGNVGLTPPLPSKAQIENEATVFARIWLSR